ncbi:hypothetical protein L596_011771 [Steinernema carpocapsae]|uniref:Uncharacterized protein n=1 Tax=Steinernema carpocapsae TaxID=34508 RepID=A0A4V6XWE4_STECR|nr:hypothetical protein L596_011771 [Steinernema carpocapsae]
MFPLLGNAVIFPLLICLTSAQVDFDYYVLTRQYPAAICRADNNARHDSCEIPEGSDTWTLHGLWPSSQTRYISKDLEFCTKDKFDRVAVKSIWKKLLQAWPNLLTGKDVTSFWKHEFEKHGTCALAYVKDELGYFNTSIAVHDKYNIDKALQSGGVKPLEDRSYALGDIKGAAEHRLGGKTMQFRCVKDKNKDWLLADVRMCLDKQLNPINCKQGLRFNQKKYESIVAQRGNTAMSVATPCPNDGIKYIASTDSMKFPKSPGSASMSSFGLSVFVVLASFFLFRLD